MRDNFLRKILRWNWHLLPQRFRTWLVFNYDNGYLKYHNLNDWRYDRRLNIATRWERPFGEEEAFAAELGDPVMTQSTPYAYLHRLKGYLQLDHDDTLLDIGCGAGRVAIYMADGPLGHSRGIDFDATAFGAASENHASMAIDSSKVIFTRGDAAQASIDDATVIFFGNPFGPATMKRVLKNIQKSLTRHPRTLRICYYNPLCHSLFDDAPWLSKAHSIPSQKKSIFIYRHDPESKGNESTEQVAE